MALKFITTFPIFGPPVPPTPASPTEVRFARWNNANAEPFNHKRRAQQQIEDEIRLTRRFQSVQNIADNYEDATDGAGTGNFKSIGTPSSPSAPSIPGKKSKYSERSGSHPAFRRVEKRISIDKFPQIYRANREMSNVSVLEDGVSYKIEGIPFEMKYSYTETPKVKPLAVREPPYSPFGPGTMARPWTGRAPLPPSKKKLKEFDSFVLPPPHKKGVKPVQAPGPFLAGSGPKYVRSREEILGEPLTKEEIDAMVTSCIKTKRQLNIGRDGLTHNMLDNIHAHWKRRRVCKIKCKGVCTVDMDNVKQQLEEKTGGKVIFSRGGVLFLFRGRNYNYKTRPRYPLMLWKPVTPVYPRLVKRAPEGLTLEEAGIMRKKGRKLIPICKLAKNGVYKELVKHAREAFEACELVRINCQGLKASDYRKIGGKLRDLVPCVLISFEHEHILMWRGREWRSSLPNPEDNREKSAGSEKDDAIPVSPPVTVQEQSISLVSGISVTGTITDSLETTIFLRDSEDVNQMESEDILSPEGNVRFSVSSDNSDVSKIAGDESLCSNKDIANDEIEATRDINNIEVSDGTVCARDKHKTLVVGSETGLGERKTQLESQVVVTRNHSSLQEVSEVSGDRSELQRSTKASTEAVLLLRRQALESGSAVILEDAPLNADIAYARAVAFAQSAPPDPVFRLRPRKIAIRKSEKEETGGSEVKEFLTVAEVRTIERKGPRNKMKQKKEDFPSEVSKGSLRVDELAKLLA